MNLRRVNYSLSYYETKISEYTLLTEYNPKFINTKIKALHYTNRDDVSLKYLTYDYK